MGKQVWSVHLVSVGSVDSIQSLKEKKNSFLWKAVSLFNADINDVFLVGTLNQDKSVSDSLKKKLIASKLFPLFLPLL